jgi:hypothetical protein
VGEPGHLAVADQLIEADTGNMVPGTPILWSIRPERVTLIESGGLDGTLVDIADVGTAVDLFVAVAPGLELQVRATQWRDFELGDPCHLALPSEAITVWRADPALSAQPAARSRHSSL